MADKPRILEYEAKMPVLRIWGLPRPLWLLVAGFCGFVELAGWFATDGRISGWDDITFIMAFAALGLVALFNGIRLSSYVR